ncbi:MAG: hypothetical protein PHO15_07510 [Eubacteriales bacterium]|nr:hypothetical protein [Eubacteriales bacterium]
MVVGVGVSVGVGVTVTVGVGVDVGVAVAVGFGVGVTVGVAVAVGFGVVGFGVAVAVGFGVAVTEGFGVAVAEGFGVAVAVGFGVAEALGVGVAEGRSAAVTEGVSVAVGAVMLDVLVKDDAGVPVAVLERTGSLVCAAASSAAATIDTGCVSSTSDGTDAPPGMMIAISTTIVTTSPKTANTVKKRFLFHRLVGLKLSRYVETPRSAALSGFRAPRLCQRGCFDFRGYCP